MEWIKIETSVELTLGLHNTELVFSLFNLDGHMLSWETLDFILSDNVKSRMMCVLLHEMKCYGTCEILIDVVLRLMIF